MATRFSNIDPFALVARRFYSFSTPIRDLCGHESRVTQESSSKRTILFNS